MTDPLIPLRQTWPADLVARYRAAGHWRGETFPAMLRDRAARFAERTAIVGGDARWTYAELARRAEAIAAGLLARGLQPGERVVVQLGNIPAFYAVVFGLFRAGLVPVYALPAHRSTEIAHFVKKAQASAYVVADRYDGFDHRPLAREILAMDLGLREVIVVGDAQEFTALDSLAGDPAALPRQDPDPQSVAFLQISGGSTGLSKLIPRTHDDYIYSFRASNTICGITQDSVYLVALPAAHNFPMSSPGALGVLYAGGTVVLSPSPSPDQAFPLIERERVTDLGLVPPLALLWAQAAATTPHDLSSLRVLQVGGAKLTPEAARRVVAGLPVKLQQVFGMAEGLVNYTRLDDDEDTILGTQGRPISPDDEVLVVDDAGQPVPDGTVGHLLTRGPYTIRGYHNDEAANARSFTADGFYRTGDMVLRKPGGYLVVQGRAHDHINRAGEKISAEEVEDHLLAHPQVFDVAVVSIPDEYLGERICAFVIPHGEKPRPPEVKAWMRGRGVAAFKIPDQIVFVPAFDQTAVGKTSRKELRARLRADFLASETK
ncbi:2,3-dihydroxybenzoate-AMP ligase [Pseudorhodoferax aquiterrae]|uniref:2,3-dihydroxybenzoate-AMP ligase n=1 Tax=Pseudorhodoferax aquiterrae TaxID=747304 RepID=A0ABQ3FWR9_9BURK|nr:AMP-binding protein [Pseudorhodoferax aquiterrae]GHC71845.1 2,3-dihydroxybenzoate-AMP ligase [Pseudorhodoferax aquiterrae]